MSNINEQPLAPPETPPPTAARPAPAGSRWVVPIVVGVVSLLVGAAAGSAVTAVVIGAAQRADDAAMAEAAEQAKSEFFSDAANQCNLDGVVEIADQGRTMIVDGEGEDFGSGDVSFSDLDCIIDAVGAPASVKELMYSTRSLDGRQSGEWDDISASWSYHPDDGLDIIFEIVE